MVFPPGDLPCKQGTDSKTFKLPPLDGTLALHQIYEYNAENSPDHPLYVYDTPEGESQRIAWREVRPAIHRAAKFAINAVSSVTKDSASPVIVGVFANSGEGLANSLLHIC